MSEDHYRFTIGTRVLCRTGPDEWTAGEIVALNYTEECLQGRIVPYQVQLDEGFLCYVPQDTHEYCRKLVAPWWEAKVFAARPESWFLDDPPAKIIYEAYENTHPEIRDVNEADHKGKTALMRVVQINWHSGVKELLELRADVNLVTGKNQHALHFAVTHGQAITKSLVDAKAALDCQEDDPDFDPEFTSTTFGDRKSHRTPLQIAVLIGDAAVAQLLLDEGANIDIQDAQLKTALHLAIEEKNSKMIELLLMYKADVNLGNIESGINNTPLMGAAHTGNLLLITMLISARAAINQQGKQGMSACHLAARRGEAKIVEVLIESRADVNQKSQCGSLEQLARKNGNAELLKVLGLSGCGSSDSGLLSAKSLCAAQRTELYMD
jgi:ankyrin repeat protein